MRERSQARSQSVKSAPSRRRSPLYSATASSGTENSPEAHCGLAASPSPRRPSSVTRASNAAASLNLYPGGGASDRGEHRGQSQGSAGAGLSSSTVVGWLEPVVGAPGLSAPHP